MNRSIDAIVIGASAGGVESLSSIFSSLTHPLSVPVIVVLHIPAHGTVRAEAFGKHPLFIKEAEDKEVILPGHVYFAPHGYHLLIENDLSLSLSVEEPVEFARPSIDVLFESAGAVFEDRLLGIILTGSSSDGSNGLYSIHQKGGITIVQNPEQAFYKAMPEAALKLFEPTMVLKLEDIASVLSNIESRN